MPARRPARAHRPVRLSADAILRLTLARQGLLTRTRETDLLAAVERFGPLHAADHRTPYLSLLARLDGFAFADLDRAWLVERHLDRRPAMRRTLHLVPASRIGGIVSIYGNLAGVNGRLREAGIELAEAQRFGKAIEAILERESSLELNGLKRRLPEELQARAAEKTRHGSVLAVIARWLLETGVIAVAARKDPSTGRPASGWAHVPQSYERSTAAFGTAPEGALTDLARWYFEAHGPAAAEDWAWWSGLPLARARSAFEQVRGGLVEVTVDPWPPLYATPEALESAAGPGRDGPFGPRHDGPLVRLLPYEDGAMKAYRATRGRFFDERIGARQQTEFGELLPSVLVDGRVAGTWSHGVGGFASALDARTGRTARGLSAELFGPADRAVREALEAELDRVRAAIPA